MTPLRRRWTWLVPAAVLLAAAPGSAQELLTADRAVQVALQKNPQVVNSRASVRDARGGVYSSASGVLPRLSASVSRGGSWTDNRAGREFVGGLPTPPVTFDDESYSTVPQISGSWNIIDLSGWADLSSARRGLQAAKLQETSTRNDIALEVRREFYEVVGSIHLARVNTEALKLSRDDERRVRALFEVGSVSKSDVLKAQVRTSQSQLDSLTAAHRVVTQRMQLASSIGVPEAELGTIDTTLTVTAREFDRDTVLAEAEHNRPDIRAAEAELKSAHAGVTSARFAYLPYVSLAGAAQYNTAFTSTTTYPNRGDTTFFARTDNDAVYRASVSLNWDFFNGLGTQGRNAAAQARLIRAQETRDGLRRNLTAEVEQALLSYREALEGRIVAQSAVESATENLKLTQQKYNVGSSTILDLIDAQVSLQRAQNQEVTALAAIRVADAAIRRVSGRTE